MKKIIKILFMASIAALIGCKEFVYELNSDKTGYILKKYKGSSESVIIPELYKNLPVIEIGDNAFQANKYIKGDLVIPENIVKIGNHAFSSTNINSLVISKNVEIIDDYAFFECKNLANITFHDNIKEIKRGAFFRCYELTGNLNIPKGLTKISDSAFSSTGYTGLTIPNNIKIIEEDAFRGSNLTGHIIIPDSVVEIGDNAFMACSMEKITISKNIKKINEMTFRICNELKEVVIPEGIVEIGGWAFFECFGLKSVVIPSTVTSIGDLAFADSNNLIKIICNASNPPVIYNSIFENSPVRTIIVPEDSVAAYQQAPVWKKFASIITSQ